MTVPTHVGMNLPSCQILLRIGNCPHTCGDEPVNGGAIVGEHDTYLQDEF
jgi:hypothetical protein